MTLAGIFSVSVGDAGQMEVNETLTVSDIIGPVRKSLLFA
jgi:hypothetical protein